MSIQNRIYNLKIERVEDHGLPVKAYTVAKLPANVDLRPKLPPVYDQGDLGSCTANALVAAYQYDSPSFMGSRLFLYYNERKLENDIPDDAGALLSDGIKCLLKYGLCPETEWPYDIPKFAVQPPNNCYTDALIHRAVTVANIPNDLTTMKTILNTGFPFVAGIAIYSSFATASVAKTGMVPMPSRNDNLLGGHAVLVCGYNDKISRFIVRNSWGPDWGDKGYFYLPYNYLTNKSLSSDMWEIKAVTK